MALRLMAYGLCGAGGSLAVNGQLVAGVILGIVGVIAGAMLDRDRRAALSAQEDSRG